MRLLAHFPPFLPHTFFFRSMFIIYTPPLHTVFGGTYKLDPLYWLIPVGFGCVLLGWSTIRVYITRRRLNSERVKPVKGLNMSVAYLPWLTGGNGS